MNLLLRWTSPSQLSLTNRPSTVGGMRPTGRTDSQRYVKQTGSVSQVPRCCLGPWCFVCEPVTFVHPWFRPPPPCLVPCVKSMFVPLPVTCVIVVCLLASYRRPFSTFTLCCRKKKWKELGALCSRSVVFVIKALGAGFASPPPPPLAFGCFPLLALRLVASASFASGATPSPQHRSKPIRGVAVWWL